MERTLPVKMVKAQFCPQVALLKRGSLLPSDAIQGDLRCSPPTTSSESNTPRGPLWGSSFTAKSTGPSVAFRGPPRG